MGGVTGTGGVNFDRVDGATSVIEVEHHEVHEGNFYTVADNDTDVDILVPKYWHLIAPNTTTRIHLKFAGNADTSGLWEFYENPTTTNDGTGLNELNNDRNSTNTSTLQTFRDPVVGADGTLIWNMRQGATAPPTKSSGTARNGAEWILKQNEQYLIKYTPDSDNAEATIAIEYYEE